LLDRYLERDPGKEAFIGLNRVLIAVPLRADRVIQSTIHAMNAYGMNDGAARQ
jgi:hypothetical protein